MIYIPYLWIAPFLLLSILVGLFLIIYLIIRSRNSLTYFSFMLAVTFLLVWDVCQFYELIYGKQIKGVVYFLEYTVVCFSGVLWLILCLQFSKSKFILKRTNVFILNLPPVLFYICFLTNNFHHLFFYSSKENIREYGILFLIHSVVSYSYVFVGVTYMLRYSFRNILQIKFQAILLIISFLFVVITTAVRVTGIIRFDVVLINEVRENYDISSLSVLATLSLLLFIIYRYRFLSIMPVAYKEILKNMNESVLVIDNRNKIFIKNKAFEINFEKVLQEHNYSNISSFADYLEKNVAESKDKAHVIEAIRCPVNDTVTGEIGMVKTKKTFTVSIRPIMIHTKYNGKIISFIDISGYRNLLDKLDKKNVELTELNDELSFLNEDLQSANIKLKELARTEKELVITKERNRFAQDVHDTLGHSMTILIKLMEASILNLNDNPERAKNILTRAIDTARYGLAEVKLSLSGLINEKLGEEGLISALENLIQMFKMTEMDIQISIDEEFIESDNEFTDVLYRTCQEALTNAFRHGHATEVQLILKNQGDRIKLYIFDNGSGCEGIHKGMGLSGMEQRIKELHGEIFFSSHKGNGFSIRVELPKQK